MAARSSLLVRGATLLGDRSRRSLDETKGVWTHAGLLAKLRVRVEVAKGLATAIKELESAPQGNHT